MAKKKHNPSDSDERFPEISDGPGASDGNSGGGAGAGIADAETTLRTGDPAPESDVKHDREKLFPETRGKKTSKR